MILRNLIVERVVDYFTNDITWKLFMNNLARGKELLHGHPFIDSILHPEPVRKVIKGYLETHGLHLLREPFLRGGRVPGRVVIQDIYPEGTAFFEVITRYSKEQVLASTIPSATSNNRNPDLWDREWSERGYAQFDWKTKLTAEDEKDLIAFFNSPEWEALCRFGYDEKGQHAFLRIETSIHPQIIQEFEAKAFEARGWEFSRSVSFPGFANPASGSILSLMKKPELSTSAVNMGWRFNPDVSIKPVSVTEPITEKVTEADLVPAMAGIEYIEVDDEAVQEIIELCKPK